jgi:tRNA(fMet)-specific endonuclease VapC
MIQFILDTDILSLLQRQHPQVLAAVAAHRLAVSVSTISIEEQFGGWFTRLRQAKSSQEYAKISGYLAATVEALTSFPVIPMTEAAADRFQVLRKLNRNVGTNDLRIAAIALEAGATVVTRNSRDFSRVPGLLFVDWSA